MKKTHLPRKIRAALGTLTLTGLAATPGAMAVSVYESSPTPQAVGMNAVFMEYLPAPGAPASVCGGHRRRPDR